jgi:hypothetical protein
MDVAAKGLNVGAGEFTPGASIAGLTPGADLPMEGPQEQAKIAAHLAMTASQHAENLAQHTTALAQWVQKLYADQQNLQSKVTELEEWKKRTLEEMRKLRDEHKQLRKRYGADEPLVAAPEGPRKVVSAPPTLPPPPPDKPAKVFEDPSPITPPPGLVPSLSQVESDAVNEGIVIKEEMVGGFEVKRATWRIGNLSVKLRGCMGRAVVSPPFSAWEMNDLRLMLFADLNQKGTEKGSRKAKESYQKKVSEGPLDGSLKLKVPECPKQPVLTYCFKLGDLPIDGPQWNSHDFSAQSVSEQVEFKEDWLKQTTEDGALTVSVDIQNWKKEDDTK